MKKVNKWQKSALGAAVALAITCGSAQTEAAMLDAVPAGDWSYAAVNELVAAGAVPGYEVEIPAGQTLSRIEMAMIVDAAKGNTALTAEQRATVEQLNKSYYYDIKKVALLNKLDRLDESKLDAAGETLTTEEKASIKKAASLADKLSISGYARIRNDHYLKDSGHGTQTTRTTRANMLTIMVNTAYKVNENWTANTELEYRNSLSGFDDKKVAMLNGGEDNTKLNWHTYVVGKMPQLGLTAKLGKWNEWNAYGWGMDVDCDFSGAQFTYGKKDFKTYLSLGQMDLWDDAMGGTRTQEKVSSLRFYYPFDKNNDVNFGVSYTSAMASRYQDPDQGRVFYYYAHARHRFDSNWQVRAGLIDSNAKRDPSNSLAGTKTKQPGRWLQLDYKGAKLNQPGSYGITATYRYEPALSWPTVTDWCGLNERFFRLGVSYVPAKNILLNSFYSWQREIDTGARGDLYRFQAQFFF